MYDLLAVVWSACSTAIEQGTGKESSLFESVLEDGCGDIVKDQQRWTKRYTTYRESVRGLRTAKQRECLWSIC